MKEPKLLHNKCAVKPILIYRFS
ncbi:hypothetical protein SPRA44_350054 [Serratia proteamaculans]|nr:hypothetical protein SPRA44_350054 [Serratia proteamaculans]